MPIRRFLRVTAHNFRVFWRASFTGESGPVLIGEMENRREEGEQGMKKKDAMEEIQQIDESPTAETAPFDDDLNIAAREEFTEASSLERAKESPAVRTEEDEEEEREEGAAPISDAPGQAAPDVGESGIPSSQPFSADDVLLLQEDDDVLAAEAASVLSDEAEADTVSPDEAGREVDDEEIDAATQEPKGPLVQAELEIVEGSNGLPAEIMVESHGRRLGLTQLVESLLFVSDEAPDAVQLAKALNVTLESIHATLQRLDRLYRQDGRGLRLQNRDGRYLLVTAPETAGAIEDFLNLDLTTKLSGPALETLAVIAYRQPATRLQVEAVRGVDCAGVLRSLIQRGLIEEVGRLETVGRPILYGVTDLFMQHFGLMDLKELPPLETQDDDMLWAATQLAEMEVTETSIERQP